MGETIGLSGLARHVLPELCREAAGRDEGWVLMVTLERLVAANALDVQATVRELERLALVRRDPTPPCRVMPTPKGLEAARTLAIGDEVNVGLAGRG